MSTSERRAPGRDDVRTGVVWDAVQARLAAGSRVVDIGGGTGGFAVRLAQQGHPVTVVDPSPDALAALDRRADEAGVADLVTGVLGDTADLADLEETAAGSADVVLCHGVLEVVPDPAAALRTIAEVLRPGGLLSLLVAQRHAAVVARAMAGHFQQALALLDGPRVARSGQAAGGRGGRRYTADEVGTLLADTGFTVGGDPRRPGLRRPGARLAARPRARCHRRPGRPRAGRGRPPRVPSPRDPGARARDALGPGWQR